MLSRRTFLSNLAVGVACLCARFRAETVAEIDRANDVLPDGEYEVGFIVASSSFTRLAPVQFDGQLFSRLPNPSPFIFTVKNGIIFPGQ